MHVDVHVCIISYGRSVLLLCLWSCILCQTRVGTVVKCHTIVPDISIIANLYFCQGFDVCRSCRWRWRVYSWTHVTWCIDGAQIIPPFVWKPSLYPLQGTRFMHEHNLVKHQASSVKHHQVNWLVQLGGPWLLYMYILKGLLLLLLVIFLLGVFVGCSSRSGPLL